MKQSTQYVSEVTSELKKTVWPTRRELLSYTFVVICFLVFMLLLIGGTDAGVSQLVEMLLLNN